MEWLLVQFACAKTDTILVNVNPSFKAHELAYGMKKVGIKSLIMPENFKSSNYYENLLQIVPEFAQAKLGQTTIKSKDFPELEHVILLGDK